MTEQVFAAWRPQDRETAAAWLLLAFVVILGAVLRFWGLGNIGLHGDEDVMALATRGILETGSPVIPSGMYYPRALPQLYLMALSVAAFGDSEWSLRLPSAVMGTLMIAIAYWFGRRFLTVRWSLLLAAVIALLPVMIAQSQTARMYVFLASFVMLFAIALFRWERTGSTADWLWAVAAVIAALQFHTLAVFAALLFFYPGLLHGSRRSFGLGAVAFAVCLVAYKLVAEWHSAQYFPLVSRAGDGTLDGAVGLQKEIGLGAAAAAAAFIVAAAAAAWLVARRLRHAATAWFVAGVALLAAAAALALLVQYHLAGLAWFFGTIFYVRSGRRVLVPAVLASVLLVLLAWHAYTAWHAPGVRTLLNLAEALAGTPKPLPYLTLFLFSPPAVTVYALMLLYFGVRFARGHPLPDHVLLFLGGVFAPLFLIGFLEDTYIPERYITGLIPLFLLSVFAGITYLLREYGSRARALPAPAHVIAALVVFAIFIDPAEFRYNVNPHYRDFPYLAEHRGVDHKGAAAYVMEQDSDGHDLVIVMDSQQQGYYLPGRMDYYMRSLLNRRNSTIMRGGTMHNLYTGIPQIATGERLAEVLRDAAPYDQVLVVGSGELEDHLAEFTADGIWETMQAFGFRKSWSGRDGATSVWEYRPGDRLPASARDASR